jgi:uncharacterized repeat protein (TIGR03803 family)
MSRSHPLLSIGSRNLPSIMVSDQRNLRSRRKSDSLFGLNCVPICIVVCMAMAVASPAQTFSTIFSFDGSNGRSPNGPLIQGFDGSLYGTTVIGGAHSLGTVFRFNANRTVTTLHNFCSRTACWDGGVPKSGLVLGRDGNLYGTTTYGGAHKVGTIFKITPQGVLTTLHHFCAQASCADGYGTTQPLIQAADGNFYGAAPSGGINHAGTIFKVSPGGNFKLLYSFCAKAQCADGSAPNGLIQATDGNFYGTATFGTVFRVTPGGTLTTLHRFCSRANCSDGYEPMGALTQASDGVLYGTTAYGGGNSSFGTVFKITLQGSFTIVHRFCTDVDCIGGGVPQSTLIQGTEGNLYGTTSRRHSAQFGGSLFKITRTGILTVLRTFPDWRVDFPGVMQATDGNFYGTTYDQSASYFGTIFKLKMGLSPFIKTVPIAGASGTTVIILGTNLSGATSVKFGGRAAPFSVVSSSEIRTVVPTDATSGIVTVVTPNSVLSSNVVFRVP